MERRSDAEIKNIIREAQEKARRYFQRYHKLPRARKYRARWAHKTRKDARPFVVGGYIHDNGRIEFNYSRVSKRPTLPKKKS